MAQPSGLQLPPAPAPASSFVGARNPRQLSAPAQRLNLPLKSVVRVGSGRKAIPARVFAPASAMYQPSPLSGAQIRQHDVVVSGGRNDRWFVCGLH